MKVDLKSGGYISFHDECPHCGADLEIEGVDFCDAEFECPNPHCKKMLKIEHDYSRVEYENGDTDEYPIWTLQIGNNTNGKS